MFNEQALFKIMLVVVAIILIVSGARGRFGSALAALLVPQALSENTLNS